MFHGTINLKAIRNFPYLFVTKGFFIISTLPVENFVDKAVYRRAKPRNFWVCNKLPKKAAN